MPVAKVRDYAPVPEGDWSGTLLRVDEITLPGYGDRWAWVFGIALADGACAELRKLTSTSFSPGNKAGLKQSHAWQYATTLLGRRPPLEFELDELVGKAALLRIQVVEREGVKYSNIVEILPLDGDRPKPVAGSGMLAEVPF
jgi:hypothetical protein